MNALVTAKTSNLIFLQVKESDADYHGPDYSALVVATAAGGTSGIEPGTRITVDGTLTTFLGLRAIDKFTNLVVTLSAIEAPPLPVAEATLDVASGGSHANRGSV